MSARGDSRNFPKVESVEGFRRAVKSITFDGGTANAIGDYDGTGDPFDIFTVTGAVAVRLLAYCGTSLVGALATLKVGTSTNDDKIIEDTTATEIDANDIWHDSSPDSTVESLGVLVENIVTEDIIGTVSTANITAGEITFVALWKPLSRNGNVVPA